MNRVSLAALLALLVLGLAGDSAAVRAHIRAGVVFSGNFESGSYAPWPRPQCSNFGYSLGQNGAIANFGPFYVEKPGAATHAGDVVPAAEGAFFGSYALPGDTTHKQRCQTNVKRPTGYNSDDYYGLMVYVPVGWYSWGSWGPVIAELNFQTNLNVPSAKALSLTLRPDAQGDTTHDHVTLGMTTGFDNATQPYFTNVSDADSPGTCRGTLLPCRLYAIPPGAFKQGVWMELVVHDHWATTSTGTVEAWFREKGQTTWTKSVSLSNVPTLQYDATHDGSGTSLENIGVYRGPAAMATTVYLDAFTRATSFAAAAAALP